MNHVLLTPDVRLFVAAVREHLADLTEEEREELVGGLEGDMSDLVTERGAEALPEPAAYAAELRTAAGFDPETARRGEPLAQRVHDLLDAAHARWDGLVEGLPGRPWELLVALRPVWWVFRAWVALSLVDLVWGGGSIGVGLSVVPSLDLLTWPLLVLAVLGSVLVGLKRVWPGRGGAAGRGMLLLLNAVAVLAAPACLASYTSAAEVDGWYAGQSVAVPEGLSQDGREIRNIHAYDAQGRPLIGVQLVDQDGQPIEVTPTYWDAAQGADVELTPWRAGMQDVLSVFPLPERRTDQTGDLPLEPTLPEPPVASLPPVALDGVTASRQVTDTELRAVERWREVRELRRERARERASG